MPVKTVFIPLGVKLPNTEDNGGLIKYRQRLEQIIVERESQLDDLLSDGYTVVLSHILDSQHEQTLVVVLHKHPFTIALDQAMDECDSL